MKSVERGFSLLLCCFASQRLANPGIYCECCPMIACTFLRLVLVYKVMLIIGFLKWFSYLLKFLSLFLRFCQRRKRFAEVAGSDRNQTVVASLINLPQLVISCLLYVTALCLV